MDDDATIVEITVCHDGQVITTLHDDKWTFQLVETLAPYNYRVECYEEKHE